MSEVKPRSEGRPDWVFLVFLFLFTNQAVFSYKIVGLVFIYLLRPNFRFGLKQGRLPRFYLYIIALSFINLFINIRDFSVSYIAAFSMAMSLWLFAFLAYHQLKLSLEKFGPQGIHKTMRVFIVLNLLFSLYQLGKIIVATGKLNPYTGLDFPYGMSTGDNIYGFFMQNSYYNMMVSAFLGIYFLYKRDLVYSIIACICLILVFGNVGTMAFILTIGAMYLVGLIFKIVRRSQKRDGWLLRLKPPGRFQVYIPLLAIFIVIFYSVLSPENFKYVVDKIESKVFNIQSETKNSLVSLTEAKTIDYTAYNPFRDVYNTQTTARKEYTLQDVHTSAGASANQNLDINKLVTMSYIKQFKGKTLSILETVNFLKSSTRNAIFGAGPVRFSSLTAQKMAGYDSSRLFLQILPHYISPYFRENHLLLIEGRIKSESQYFSNANWPDSFYNQLLGEYGLLGCFLFILFYVGYFLRYVRYWSYSFWFFILIIPFFHISYMLEPLCVMIFFELLVESDIMENRIKEMNNE